MMDGSAPKIRRVLCPRCRCVLVEDPHIPVYKCGKCDAVLQAKHCKTGAKLHNPAGANGNASPGGLESTSYATNTPVDSPQLVSVSSNGKTLLETPCWSAMEIVDEVNIKGEIPTYGCNTASFVVDTFEAGIPCIDSSNGCKSTLDMDDNPRNKAATVDASTGSLERDTLERNKGEIPTYGCNTASSMVDNFEAGIPCLDSSNGCKSTLDMDDNPRNKAPTVDASTGSFVGDTIMVKAQTVDASADQSEIDTPKDEVPNLDGCSSSNSRQLSPEREIDKTKRNGEHVSLDDLSTRNENISEMENVKDEAPPTNSGSSCNSEQLSPKTNGKTESDKVWAEHTVLCNMLVESLSIGGDCSLPVRLTEEKADHLDLACLTSTEAAIDDRQISNRYENPARKPPLMVHHAYDASVSSFEDAYDNGSTSGYHLTSKRTFRSQRSSALTRSRDETNNSFANVETQKASNAWLEENAVPPRLLKQRYNSETVESFMSDRDELPTRYVGDYASDWKASAGSEDFYSVQNWTETEKDNSSLTSLSRGSEFSTPGPDHIELLRKIDELRNKLARSHDPWDKRPHFNASKQIGDWQSSSGGSASEQEIHRLPSIQSHLLDSYSTRKSMLGGCQRQVLPPLVQPDPTYFCLHCTPGHHLQANARVPAATYCSNELCGLYCHICTQPGSLKCQVHSDPCCLPQNYTHDFEKLQPKTRDQSRKRHYRPVLGGANLLTCYECLKVLQIPEEFHFSRKKCNKLRCGSCSKVLSLALVNKNQIVPYILALQLQFPTGRGHTTGDYVSTQNGIHVPPRNNRFSHWGKQVSYSDEYGPSFERSGEIEDEHVQYVSRDSTDSMIDRDIAKPPLHSLMGYISASEIIYNH